MTTLHLHNTLSRQKEEFVPLDPNHVRMYVCGPTVYDFAHIGNARPMIVFDTLYRLLKRHYPKVSYCRNITDIDDKIISKALDTGETIDVITKKTTKGFHDDLAHLNTLQPDFEPRCTETVPEMIALTQTLIDKGYAYEKDGHVLFHVPSMKDYGQLSRLSQEELIAGARVEVAPYKKDHADFILWKPSAPEQPGWDSPWGRGRPGWHLECSAMAKKHLGDTFDIHAGGLDLIFPHHENEIAQSRCANGTPILAKYWTHNGFLIVNGEKMSKSLGNFFTIRDLLAKAPGEALRLALLSTHYRSPLDFTDEGLKIAKVTLDRWYGALRNVQCGSAEKSPTPLGGGLSGGSSALPDSFESALLDDLNTPLAIAAVHELVNELNRATDPAEQAILKAQLLACGDALGILKQDPEVWFKGIASTGPTDKEIETQIAARIKARKEKNFAEADRIRDALAAQGIILEDGPAGTTWRRE